MVFERVWAREFDRDLRSFGRFFLFREFSEFCRRFAKIFLSFWIATFLIGFLTL